MVSLSRACSYHELSNVFRRSLADRDASLCASVRLWYCAVEFLFQIVHDGVLVYIARTDGRDGTWLCRMSIGISTADDELGCRDALCLV